MVDVKVVMMGAGMGGGGMGYWKEGGMLMLMFGVRGGVESYRMERRGKEMWWLMEVEWERGVGMEKGER
ncbi:hypothetical protein, partial [Paenibacillus sp. Y412MC10]|uniref:hypothetical protein n=1 Tax=Geobacillus sp. (strain Y412MC10) TaxID=481743 RepID=UPI0037CBE556